MADERFEQMDPNDRPDEFGASWAGARPPRPITLVTDRYVVRATFRSRLRRLSDALNVPGEPFLVAEDATFEDLATRMLVEGAPYAQINLSTVLFAIAHEEAAAVPEMRMVKVVQRALVIMPPFRITGELHLLPERDLHQALGELTGRFVPMTDATFRSETAFEPGTHVAMLAFNHARAQILAPYEEPVARTAENAATGHAEPGNPAGPSSG